MKYVITTYIGLLIASLLISVNSFAQSDTIVADSTAIQESIIRVSYDSVQIEKYKGQVIELINYLEYNFNLLGSDSVPAQEKDIIINNSYLKLFKDADVQIEDDLVENRVIITNKDAQAYLKDIHFFFKKVKITFDIADVTPQLTKDDNLFFKVTLNRNLKGVTVNGKATESNTTRYVEVNLDERNQDLRIASIYSTGLSIEEDLRLWYNDLDPEWKLQLANEIMITPTKSLSDYYTTDPNFLIGDTITNGAEIVSSFNNYSSESLLKLIKKKTLDLSYNDKLKDLSAIKKLSKLKNLDISYSTITDISSLRNISSLVKLEMGNTSVSDITNLKYCIDLEELYMNNTLVSDVSVLSNFSKLKKLYCKKTPVNDISSLEYLSALQVLQISNTNVKSINALRNKNSLKRLTADSTAITDLSPLDDARNLEVLSINFSPVSSLHSVLPLNKLSKIYCQDINMDKNQLLETFINSDKQIIFFTKELNDVWKDLSDEWQTIFKSKLAIKRRPKPEELHEILKIKSIDVSNNTAIANLNALVITPKLSELNIEGTSINDINTIKQCTYITKLNISNTNIVNINALQYLPNLTEIHMNNTYAKSVSPLDSLQSIEYLYANGSPVTDFHTLKNVPVLKIIYADSTSQDEQYLSELINERNFQFIYRSKDLLKWWEKFTPDWKKLFLSHIGEENNEVNSQILHELVKIKELNIPENTIVNNFSPLRTFTYLEKISITKCNISNLVQLTYLTGLKEVDVSNCPVEDISAVQLMPNLKKLTLKNTPLENFKALKKMTKLSELDISGSQIKTLKNIDAFVELKKLNISNTYIKNIKEIDKLPVLEEFICFNTKINAKDIAQLKARHPNLKVEFY